MQSVPSKIWTHVAVFISYDDNHCTTVTSTVTWNYIIVYTLSISQIVTWGYTCLQIIKIINKE